MTAADTVTQGDASTVSKWEAFFQGTEYMQKVREVADLYPDVSSITVSYHDVDRADSDLAVDLLNHPDACLISAVQAVHNLMHQDLRKSRITIRIERLPRDARVTIRDLRGKHIGKLVAFPALVTRSIQPKHNVVTGAFQCMRCGHVIREEMRDRIFSPPMECYKEQEGCGRSSGSTKFRFLSADPDTRMEDIQKIECQEPLEDLKGGTSPARITVWLSGEVAGSVSAGSRIIVNGIPRTVQGNGKSTVLDADLDAVSIEQQSQRFADLEISPEEEAEFEQAAKDPELFDKLVRSAAPSIKGYDNEKAGLLLQLFGGVPKVLDDGTRRRGDIHILLIGDPGIAKSQLLEYMSKLSPYGVYASGKSSSGVGLTCAATKDADWGDGQWTLQAGAMVRANGGNLYVDELDKMTDEDRSAMHEGLESQRINVHKAGLDATLPTECSLGAAANPKYGRFVDEQDLAGQIDLPGTLQSRFDVIYMMRDIPNKETDGDIARHVIKAHQRGGAIVNKYHEGMGDILDRTEEIAPPFSVEWMRKYIAWTKRINPVLTDAAGDLIVKHYVTIRTSGEGPDKSIPITARQLEGYVRMAEAAARSRHSEKADVEDAKLAIRLSDYAMSRVSGGDIDIVMTGIPKKKRDKLSGLMKIIKSYGRELVSITELEEEADRELNMAPEEVREAVRKWTNDGVLTQPDPNKGMVRAV